MRSVKYKGLEIPIFDAHYYTIHKRDSEATHYNHWLERSCQYDVNASFMADSLVGIDESVLDNLNNDIVLFKLYGGCYRLVKIIELVESKQYSIGNSASLISVGNVKAYFYIGEKTDLDIDSIIRCIKIEKILN
tara:strand:+ start:185 stop:586 length:402 start_codon:yes stop_codon:yes gene_type:complete